MPRRVDARGLSCPQPVVLTQKALAELGAGTLEVLVDNPVARENVLRLARHGNCRTTVSQAGEDYLITIIKD